MLSVYLLPNTPSLDSLLEVDYFTFCSSLVLSFPVSLPLFLFPLKPSLFPKPSILPSGQTQYHFRPLSPNPLEPLDPAQVGKKQRVVEERQVDGVSRPRTRRTHDSCLDSNISDTYFLRH